jgi:hypothetical protein
MSSDKPPLLKASDSKIFYIWRQEIFIRCLSKNCSHLVCQEPTPSDLAADGFLERNNKAKAIIATATDPALLSRINNLLTDAKVTAWTVLATLEAAVVNKHAVTILSARADLDKAAQLQPDETVTQCFDRIDQHAMRLEYLGKPVDDGDIAMLYMKAIKYKHAAFITSVRPDEITTAALRERLSMIEALDDCDNETNTESVFSAKAVGNTTTPAEVPATLETVLTAMTAMTQQLQRMTTAGNRLGGRAAGSRFSARNADRYDKGLCFNCGEPGHRMAECPKPRPVKGPNPGASASKPSSVYLALSHSPLTRPAFPASPSLDFIHSASNASAATATTGSDETSSSEPASPCVIHYETASAAALRAHHSADTVYLIDSGASSHMLMREEDFDDYQPLLPNEVIQVRLGDDVCIPAVAKGSARVDFGSGEKIQLDRVLHVPGLSRSLLSVGKLTSSGIGLTFSDDKLEFTDDTNGKTLLGCTIKKTDDLYEVTVAASRPSMSQTEPSIESSNTAAVSFERVHQRLGHLGSRSI